MTVSNAGLTYADLVTFLEGGDCKGLTPGTIFTRNSCRMPFVHDLDFRAAVNVPVGRFKPEFTVDVLNLLNLFDRTQGQVLYAAFNDLLVVNGVGGGRQVHLHAQLGGAAERGALQPRRPAVALAGAARTATAVLDTSSAGTLRQRRPLRSPTRLSVQQKSRPRKGNGLSNQIAERRSSLLRQAALRMPSVTMPTFSTPAPLAASITCTMAP